MAKKQQKELDGRNMSTGMRIIVGVFAVVMALSMMLPSLAPIFAGNDSSSQTDEQADEANTDEKTDEQTEEAKPDEAKPADSELDKTIATVPENDTLKNLAEQNKTKVDKFGKRLEEDPNNLAALLNLGQTYMNWGYSARYSSSTDEETAYSEALVKKAMEYFDRYLALRASDAVSVQRALCNYYVGNTDEAVSSLTKLCEEKPDYAMGWANLGMLYEQQYDQSKALEAYAKAVETDPNDEYGAKSYAEQRIQSINSANANFNELTNEELLGTNSKPEEGLPAIIANGSNL